MWVCWFDCVGLGLAVGVVGVVAGLCFGLLCCLLGMFLWIRYLLCVVALCLWWLWVVLGCLLCETLIVLCSIDS